MMKVATNVSSFDGMTLDELEADWQRLAPKREASQRALGECFDALSRGEITVEQSRIVTAEADRINRESNQILRAMKKTRAAR